MSLQRDIVKAEDLATALAKCVMRMQKAVERENEIWPKGVQKRTANLARSIKSVGGHLERVSQKSN